MLGKFCCGSGYIRHSKSNLLSQIDLYCSLAEQDISLIKPIYYPSNYRSPEGASDEQPDWKDQVKKPLLEFLSNVDESCLYAKVPKEMIIDISGPEMKELDDNNHVNINNLS